MGVEITQDLWQSQNPLRFDPEKVDQLKRKHGLRPHWAWKKGRNERRGWGHLKAIKQGDKAFDDAMACLVVQPGDPDEQIKDGKFHVGDVVLSVQKQEDFEKSQARREFLANRRVIAAREKLSMQKELVALAAQGGTPGERAAPNYIQFSQPQMQQTRAGEELTIKSSEVRSGRKSGGK